jgi:ferrous iron transport protein A
MNWSHLKVGEKAKIVNFHDAHLSLKLLEMGFLPGTLVRLESVAPLGCPICVAIGSNYHLSLRKSEAATVEIERIDN